MDKLSLPEQIRFTDLLSTHVLAVGMGAKVITELQFLFPNGAIGIVYLMATAVSPTAIRFELQRPNRHNIPPGNGMTWKEEESVREWEAVPPIWLTCFARTELLRLSDPPRLCMQRETETVIDPGLIRQLDFIDYLAVDDEKDSSSTITDRNRDYYVRPLEEGKEYLPDIRTYLQTAVDDPNNIRFLQRVPYDSYVHLHSRFVGENTLLSLNTPVPLSEGPLLRKLGQSIIRLCPQRFGVRLSPAQMVLKILGAQKEAGYGSPVYTFTDNQTDERWGVGQPRVIDFGMSLFIDRPCGSLECRCTQSSRV